MPNNTLLDHARQAGGVQVILVDALFSARYGSLFRILPMRQIVGWTELFDQKTGLPTVGWRRLGQGITASKGKRISKSEGVFLLSGYSEVDRVKADRSPGGAEQYRQTEDEDILRAMGVECSFKLYYGSNDEEETFDGLFKRLSSNPKDKCETFVSAGGSEEGISIYAIKFGPKLFYGLYNTGSNGAIIEVYDHGVQTIDVLDEEAGKAKKLSVYQTEFNTAIGVAVYNPKSIGRIGKIDPNHKPSRKHFNELFNKMDGKPDILITTWTGIDYLEELKEAKTSYAPSDRDYDTTVDRFKGVQVMTDAALTDNEQAILDGEQPETIGEEE